MKDIIYTRFGKKYRKIGRRDKIEVGAMHSYCGGELSPILREATIGSIPANFSDERTFYNPVMNSDEVLLKKIKDLCEKEKGSERYDDDWTAAYKDGKEDLAEDILSLLKDSI
ncbi:MAG: hypothetical protein KAS32_27685 [Candidatus Peribacteraceae bacterium]|nr:hypothetical protein [Candidatus Peribacteraceae bacterium]